MTRRFLPVLVLVGLAVAACGGTATTSLELVAPTEAAAILDDLAPNVVLLDVRTAEEYAEGHIADSVNIDFMATDFADQLDELNKDIPYVVYCASGNRSGQAVDTMADLGFAELYDVDGGVAAWAAAGLPLER